MAQKEEVRTRLLHGDEMSDEDLLGAENVEMTVDIFDQDSDDEVEAAVTGEIPREEVSDDDWLDHILPGDDDEPAQENSTAQESQTAEYSPPPTGEIGDTGIPGPQGMPIEASRTLQSGPEPSDDPECLAASEEAVEPPQDTYGRCLEAFTGTHITEMCENVLEFEDVEYGNFSADVGVIMEIAARYDAGFDVNMGTAEDDLFRLAGMLVRISEPVGFWQGTADDWEQRRKSITAGIYTEFKQIKQRDNLPLTDRDAENAARTLSHQYTAPRGQAEIRSRMLTNLWFGVRAFLDVLQAAVIRKHGEMRAVEMSEGGCVPRNTDQIYPPSTAAPTPPPPSSTISRGPVQTTQTVPQSGGSFTL